MSKDVDDIINSSKNQTRTNTEPTTTEESTDVQEALQDAFEAVLDGDAPSNTTVRDDNLTALLRGLDDAGELGELMAGANDALDRDHNDAAVSKSQTLALLARVGLQEVDSSVMEMASDARTAYQTEKNTEF